MVHFKSLFFFFSLLPSSRSFSFFSPSLATLTSSISISLSLSLTHHHPCGLFPPFTAAFSSATHHPSRPCLARSPLSLRRRLLPSLLRLFHRGSWDSWFGSLNSQLLVRILVLVFLWVSSLLEFGGESQH